MLLEVSQFAIRKVSFAVAITYKTSGKNMICSSELYLSLNKLCASGISFSTIIMKHLEGTGK